MRSLSRVSSMPVMLRVSAMLLAVTAALQNVGCSVNNSFNGKQGQGQPANQNDTPKEEKTLTGEGQSSNQNDTLEGKTSPTEQLFDGTIFPAADDSITVIPPPSYELVPEVGAFVEKGAVLWRNADPIASAKLQAATDVQKEALRLSTATKERFQRMLNESEKGRPVVAPSEVEQAEYDHAQNRINATLADELLKLGTEGVSPRAGRVYVHPATKIITVHGNRREVVVTVKVGTLTDNILLEVGEYRYPAKLINTSHIGANLVLLHLRPEVDEDIDLPLGYVRVVVGSTQTLKTETQREPSPVIGTK